MFGGCFFVPFWFLAQAQQPSPPGPCGHEWWVPPHRRTVSQPCAPPSSPTSPRLLGLGIPLNISKPRRQVYNPLIPRAERNPRSPYVEGTGYCSTCIVKKCNMCFSTKIFVYQLCITKKMCATCHQKGNCLFHGSTKRKQRRIVTEVGHVEKFFFGVIPQFVFLIFL